MFRKLAVLAAVTSVVVLWTPLFLHAECVDEKKVAACGSLQTNSQRLACFDKLATEVSAQSSKPAEKGTKKLYTRDEFQKLVAGKTKDEIIALIGRPSRTISTSSVDYWVYEGITYDPASKQRDRCVMMGMYSRGPSEIGFNLC